MSPKARLTLSITTLTGAIALLLSAVSLFWLAEARFQEVREVARVSAESVKAYLLQRISTEAVPAPGAGVEEATANWRKFVEEDPRTPAFLVSAVAASPSLVEIHITGEGRMVLSSSNPDRLGRSVGVAPDLTAWTALPPWRKLAEILAPSRDLELSIPLAAGGSDSPVFTIRVVVSTLLVREAVLPQVRNLALLSLAALALAAMLAALLASVAGRPLERVSEIIDLISEGKSGSEPSPAAPDRELAALESKLALLGAQVRDASRVDHMLERFQDAVFLFDAENKFILASQAADRFLGATRWELVGHRFGEVFPDTSPLGALLQTSMKLARPVRDHLLNWTLPDGSPLPLSVTLEILTDFPDRRRLGAVVTLRDAESRRELESRIDTAHRHEAFGRLLQGVAHEIKNPLNSIYTHLQLLQMQLGDRVPEAREEMEVIGREIKTLDRMVVTLLDFTRPLELNLAETNLVDLVRDVAGLVRPQAEGKGVAVEVRSGVPDAAMALISADRALIRQALLNVVTNATECMGEPGEIRINVSRDAGACTLSVTDQGPGIPDEIQDRIFNLYFTTKGKRGSGIGLAMSHRIAQLHHGTLDFETETGQGTTFRFRFPAI